MKIKHQLSIFNALTRLLIILILWFMLPVIVEKVVYNHIDKNLVEKKQKFIEHLNDKEINDFIIRNDSSETYASFSMLHNNFVLLSRVTERGYPKQNTFINEPRIIDEEENEYRILQYNFTYKQVKYQLEIGSSLVEIKELNFVIRFFIIIVLVVILIFTFLMDTFLIEYLFKPFYRIIDTKIRKANEPDAFDHTSISSYSSDFKELDNVLGQMMNRISELFKKEKQFIANVSHELLTPVALLKNKFENLLQNKSLNDDAIDKIVSSLKTLDRLKKVINNLLLISRIENQQFEANQTIDLKGLLIQLFDDLKDRIDEKGLTVELNLQNRVAFIGNETLVYILLYNLTANAIKYNSKKGNITIADGFLNKKYYLSISDTGIGMNELKISKIFNRFTQINREQEGHGLGLAIVDSIAHFHNIEIVVISKVNEGTMFQLIFPDLKCLIIS